MTVADRESVREAVAASLSSDIVGVGRPCQIVYAYQKSELDEPNNVTVVVVTSDGTDPVITEDSIRVYGEQVLYLVIHSLVLYAKEGEWTEQQSEDAIDKLNKAILTWIQEKGDNLTSPDPALPWVTLYPVGRTEIDAVFFEGIEYRHEIFPIACLVGNSA